jgi:hypothetical protein
MVKKNTELGSQVPSTDELVAKTEALLAATAAEGILSTEIEAEISDLNGIVAAGYSTSS